MWGDALPAEVKSVWADALGPYDGDDLVAGLAATRETHKEFPPTLHQFADLCRDARRRRLSPIVAIPPPTAPTAETDAVIAEFRKGAETIGRPKDGTRREWAKRVLERAQAGTEPRPPLIAVTAAREALGIA